MRKTLGFKTFLWIIIGCTILFGVILVDEVTIKGIARSFIISSMYTIVCGGGQSLTNHLLNKKWDWVTQTNKRIGWGIFITVITTIPSVIACNYVNYVLIQKREMSTEQMFMLNLFFIVFSLGIASFMHAASFMVEWKKLSDKEIKIQKIIASSASAKFESLKSQIDPHFLFNSLNVLHSLIEENPNQAKEFTEKLSKIYRYVLDQKEKDVVKLSDEINFIKDYSDLLKIRFENSISFDFNIKEDFLQKYIAPLSLQLLLENCIKHNIATSTKPLVIKIYTTEHSVVVENNLQKKEINKNSLGIGLQNIINRYKLMSDSKVAILETENVFRVEIPLLTQKPEIMEKNEKMTFEKASKRVSELKDFYKNLASYCLIIPLLIFINLKTSPYHWFWFPLVGWGIGIVTHAISTFGIGKSWEEKKIKELMKKEK